MAGSGKPLPKRKSVKTAVPKAEPRPRVTAPGRSDKRDAVSLADPRRPTIGVRELRDSFSERLRSVRAGTTLTVTDHGEPVAMLIPYGLPAGILRMLSEGTLTWSGSKDYPRPLPPVGPTSTPATDWYQALKAEDDRALDAAIGASAADLRR